MSFVIPSINCSPKDITSVQDKIHKIGQFASWAHLDIADGIFTFHKTWNEPARWPRQAGVSLEVHLMTEDPLKEINIWSEAADVQRFIVHIETLDQPTFHSIQSKIRKSGSSLMLSLNPETPVSKLEPFIDQVIQFQVLGVHPGLSGQKFLPGVLKKISEIREAIPNAIIEVDGGMNLEVARACREAGADILVADHFIFNSPDPSKAYAELSEL